MVISNITEYNIAVFIPDGCSSAVFRTCIADTDTSQYRNTVQFYQYQSPTSTLLGTAGSTDGGATFSGLRIEDTVKIAPIYDRKLHIGGSSSIGDTFTISLRVYQHNNIV